MDIENLFDENTEEKQNTNDYYQNYNSNNNDDFLNQLNEDDTVKIEDLKKLIEQLKEIKKEYEEPHESNSIETHQGNSQGKVLTKNRNGYKPKTIPQTNYDTDNTANEIATAFINCFILCMVTAIMGTGWFLYIINHI